MDKKLKVFWRDNKDSIKNSVILVSTSVAIMGVMAMKSLNDITEIANREDRKRNE